MLVKGHRLDAMRAVTLAAQTLEALAITESRRIVHRDIKPDNLMMDLGGNFWLLDFGLARHMDLESLTATGGMGVGTLGYAPPEQYRNRKKEIDVRADIFGLGITMYEMIHGTNPFREGAATVHEVFQRIENMPLPKSGISGDSEGRLASLILYMCQRRREHRPRSAAAALTIAKALMQTGVNP
jgi:serine/threonine protein kinase